MQKQPGRAQIRFAEHLEQMFWETEVRRAVIQERVVRVERLREQLRARMDAGGPVSAAALTAEADGTGTRGGF